MNPSTLKWKPIVRQTKSQRKTRHRFRMYTYHVKDYIKVVYVPKIQRKNKRIQFKMCKNYKLKFTENKSWTANEHKNVCKHNEVYRWLLYFSRTHYMGRYLLIRVDDTVRYYPDSLQEWRTFITSAARKATIRNPSAISFLQGNWEYII